MINANLSFVNDDRFRSLFIRGSELQWGRLLESGTLQTVHLHGGRRWGFGNLFQWFQFQNSRNDGRTLLSQATRQLIRTSSPLWTTFPFRQWFALGFSSFNWWLRIMNLLQVIKCKSVPWKPVQFLKNHVIWCTPRNLAVPSVNICQFNSIFVPHLTDLYLLSTSEA